MGLLVISLVILLLIEYLYKFKNTTILKKYQVTPITII